MKKNVLEMLSVRMGAEWESYAVLAQHERENLMSELKEMLGKKKKYYLNEELRTDGLTEPCYVAYDGGNHPEYASNVFSEVNGVFIKNGKWYLDIEDDSEYPIERLSLGELKSVCDAVLNDMLAALE